MKVERQAARKLQFKKKKNCDLHSFFFVDDFLQLFFGVAHHFAADFLHVPRPVLLERVQQQQPLARRPFPLPLLKRHFLPIQNTFIFQSFC